jgi:hypothetical protein
MPSIASAEKYWTWSTGEVEDAAYTRLRFAARTSIWVANFDRPERACEPFGLFPDFPAFGSNGLRAAQLEPEPEEQFSACGANDSDEIGVSTGGEFTFRVIGPLHVSGGLDIVYTAPDGFGIKNQVIIAIPFSVTLTWYPWALRPYVQASITPLIYITDDARDYTLGAGAGLAYRLGAFADLSFGVGHHSADTADVWMLQLQLHPIL